MGPQMEFLTESMLTGLANDAFLPAQLSRGHRWASSEKALLCAILGQTVLDLHCGQEKDRHNAEQWLDPRNWHRFVLSFDVVCGYLGLDVQATAHQLRNRNILMECGWARLSSLCS